MGTGIFETIDGEVTEVSPERLAELQPPVAPELPPPPRPILCCVGTFSIMPWDIQGIDNGAGFGFAMAVDERVYWVFFSQEMSNPDYSYSITSSVGNVCVTDTTEQYVEITAPADAGDLAKFSLQIFRVS